MNTVSSSKESGSNEKVTLRIRRRRGSLLNSSVNIHSKGWLIPLKSRTSKYRLHAGRASALSILTDTKVFREVPMIWNQQDYLILSNLRGFCGGWIQMWKQIDRKRTAFCWLQQLWNGELQSLAYFRKSFWARVLGWKRGGGCMWEELESMLCDALEPWWVNNRTPKTFEVSLQTSMDFGSIEFLWPLWEHIGKWDFLIRRRWIQLRSCSFDGFLIGKFSWNSWQDRSKPLTTLSKNIRDWLLTQRLITVLVEIKIVMREFRKCPINWLDDSADWMG